MSKTKKKDPNAMVRCYKCYALGKWKNGQCIHCGQDLKTNPVGVDFYAKIVARFLGYEVPHEYKDVLSECREKTYTPHECAKIIEKQINARRV